MQHCNGNRESTMIRFWHYWDHKSLMVFQFTSTLTVCSTACAGQQKREQKIVHYWPFVWGIHRLLVNSPHKGPVMKRAFTCHDLTLNLEIIPHGYRLCIGAIWPSLNPCTIINPILLTYLLIDYIIGCLLTAFSLHHVTNDCQGVSNYWSIECLFSSLLRLTTKKYLRCVLLSLCEGNPPVTSGFPTQRDCNAEYGSSW